MAEPKPNKLLWSNLMQSADTGDQNAADYDVSVVSQSTVPLTSNEAKSDAIEYKSPTDKKHAANEQYTWDVVFVCKVGEEGKNVKCFDSDQKAFVTMSEKERFSRTTADLVSKFNKAGLKTNCYYSVQEDEVYIRVAATEKRLQQEADRIDYDLQLNHKKCLELGNAHGIKLAQRTMEKSAGIDEEAWFNLYGKYGQLDPDHAYRQELYIRYNPEPNHPRHNSFFTSVDRLKLYVTIFEADSALGGCEISMDKMSNDETHSFITWFPLHEHEKKTKLMQNWMQLKSTFKAPLNEIRGYFGEKIAFYFAFLAFYNRALVLPAIIGLGLFIWQRVKDRVDVDSVPPFAVFIALWATLFLEFWKRKEAKYRVRWGMSKFAEKEQPRPEFKGVWSPSPIDGKMTQQFPWFLRLIRLMVSQTVIWTLIGVVLASVVGVFFIRKVMVEVSATWGLIVTAIINAIQIQILNVIYGMISYKLNDYENHRTDSDYENALIAKTFLFKFVNSYNSLFYIAFFKKDDSSTKGCANNDCLTELTTQLGTIFVALIVINNAIEVGLPRLKNYLVARQNAAVMESGDENAKSKLQKFKNKSQPELEFELEPYVSTFDDFDELAIQYGYVTMFVVAFPIAPLAALLNNVLETRIDSQKVCTVTRRPEPRGAANIGTWYSILNIVGFIAVITNLAIVAFATEVITNWWTPRTGTDGRAERAYFFILTEHAVMLAKFAIDYFTPDEPAELVEHLARQEYVVNVLINGMEEEEEPEISDDAIQEKTPLNYKDFNWAGVTKEIVIDAHTWKAPEVALPDVDVPPLTNA